MNISSILITIVGIIIIIALYVMSRVGQNKLPKSQTSDLPDIKDDNGDQFTSVLDDIPATDGISPIVTGGQNNITQNEVNNKANKQTSNTVKRDSTEKHQLVLFISALNTESLDGNLIKQSLIDHDLILGDKDIYHYHIDNLSEENSQPSASLFRVANGIEPWTLKDQDLDNQQIVGLSLVMLLPTVIDPKEALKMFVQKAESIAIQTKGILKNQQQQTLTDKDKQEILDM